MLGLHSEYGQGDGDGSRLPKNKFQPQRTMIRSLEELQPKEATNKFFPSPMDEPFCGWAPEIQVLGENDLRKIEK